MNVKIIVLIIIIVLILLLLIYTIVTQVEEGEKVSIVKNTYLPQHLKAIVPYKDFDRCFNPSLFEYKNTIYYVHRVYRGRLTLNKASKKYLPNDGDLSRILITDNTNHWIVNTTNLHTDLNGFQDPRAIIYRNKYLLLIANDEDVDTKLNQMYALQFLLTDLDPSNTVITPIKIINFKYEIDKIQKNWMPFIYGNKLHFVYNMNPLIILETNLSNGACKEIRKINYEIPKNLRGGSNLIPWNSPYNGNVYLGVTHSRYMFVYVHNFFILNQNLHLISLSRAFIIKDDHLLFINEKTLQLFKNTKFIQNRIQYIAGILQKNSNFHITYGESDFNSKELIINEKEVSKTLKQSNY